MAGSILKNSMDIAVDIQFFKGNDGHVLPKEVAIISLNDDFQSHWIIKPPFNSAKISPDSLRQNNWLSKHHHGLDWHDGDITIKALNKNLQQISKHVGKVYVMGRDKVAYLHAIIAREIINLEVDSDCPSIQNLPWVDLYCMQHATKFCYMKYSCALNNAARLKAWLNLNLKNQIHGEDTVDVINNEQLGDF